MNLSKLLTAHSLFGRINNQISHEQMLALRQRYIDAAMKAMEEDNMPRFQYESYWIARTEQAVQYA